MSMVKKKCVRVLVVEDSRVIAEFLTHVLNADPEIEVVGLATDGEEAVVAAQRTRPDVITMDIHMPKVNGFDATRKIMETCPAPIVIVSGSVNAAEVAVAFRAIEAGAVAAVQRPTVTGLRGDGAAVKELVDTVKLMSEVKVVRRWPRAQIEPVPHPKPAIRKMPRPAQAQVVAMGASTGGPLVLQAVLSRLPKHFSLPLLMVQHMAPGFVCGFADWLASTSGYAVRVAQEGEVLLPGHAYVAPDDVHLGVRRDRRILLSKTEREHGLRPAVSFLFRSVEQAFGSAVIGVLLTGMGRDGASELRDLKSAGAMTIAQDEASSIVHGMPGEAIQLGAATYVLSPEAIAETLVDLVVKS
jgi:two-component system, chemotaxis family, protein-glutamate methylesterase/glutaminase